MYFYSNSSAPGTSVSAVFRMARAETGVPHGIFLNTGLRALNSA